MSKMRGKVDARATHARLNRHSWIFSGRFDVHGDLRCAELALDRRLYFVRETMRIVHRYRAIDGDGHFREQLTRRGEARSHVAHVSNAVDRHHELTQLMRIQRALIDEN